MVITERFFYFPFTYEAKINIKTGIREATPVQPISMLKYTNISLVYIFLVKLLTREENKREIKEKVGRWNGWVLGRKRIRLEQGKNTDKR